MPGRVTISARAIIRVCSPPFPNTDLGVTDSCQLFRACTGDAPGLATQLTDFTDGRTVVEDLMNPTLSPDGTKILFETLSSGNDWEIWVVDNVPGSTATQLVAVNDEHYYHPSWAPDSDTFVYVKGSESRSGGAMAIYKDTVSAPGSPTLLKSQASTTFGYFARPRFNFDGTRIAYMQSNDIVDDLRCMDADGSNDGQVDTINGYDFNDPPAFGWANTQNLLAWQDGGFGVWLADDTGGGLVELNANGVAAGLPGSISDRCFPADDSFVVWTTGLAIIPGLRSLIRGELDGSDTTELNATEGAPNSTYLKAPIIYNGRIWFFQAGGSAHVDTGTNFNYLASVALDGTDYVRALDVTAGAPNMEEFGNDWMIYFN